MGSRATAKAKSDVVAALKAFKASCRARQARFLRLMRELAKEHERDVETLSEAGDAFVRTVDPNGLVANPEEWAFVNWGPGEVDVPDRDSVGDIVPGGDVDDALDDVDAILDEAKNHYEG